MVKSRVPSEETERLLVTFYSNRNISIQACSLRVGAVDIEYRGRSCSSYWNAKNWTDRRLEGRFTKHFNSLTIFLLFEDTEPIQKTPLGVSLESIELPERASHRSKAFTPSRWTPKGTDQYFGDRVTPVKSVDRCGCRIPFRQRLPRVRRQPVHERPCVLATL